MANTSIRIDTVGLGINWALGETYRVQIDEGFLLQEGGLQLPLSGGNITTFTTPNNPPTVASTYPTNGTTASEENQTITIAVDRANIVGLSGNVYLYKKATPNVLITTYRVNSNTSISANTTAVGLGYYNNTDTIYGNIITIPIHHYLEANTSYFVRTDANIIQDLNGHKFTAITSNTAFAWTTSNSWQKDLSSSPVVTYNEDTTKKILTPTVINDINNIIGYENNSYTLAITSTTNVRIRSLTINGSNWTNNIHTLTGNASSINGQLANVVLTPADDGIDSIILNYSLTTPPGNVYTRLQTIPCVSVNQETLNLAVSRTYQYGNTSQLLMPTSPIQVGDDGVGSVDNYEVYISSTNIVIGFNDNNPLYISGSKNSVNASLANVMITSPTGYIGNTSFTYTQIRNGTTQTTSTIDVIQTNVIGNLNASVTKTTQGYYDLYYINSSNYVRLSGDTPIRFVLVGGGGGGGRGAFGSGNPFTTTGGGGGGGGIIETLSDYYSGSYLITVGQGGETNSNGGDTIGFGQTAYGGGSGAYTFRRTNTGGSGTIDLGSINATSGGSGGGGGMYSPDSLGNFESHKFGGNGVVTQGYAGGNGGYSYSGGGGGAGGLGNVILSEYPIGGGPGKTVFDGITYSPGGNGGLAFVNTSSDVSIKGAGGHGGGTPNLAGRQGANGLAIVAVVDPSALPNAPTNVSASISSTTFTSATATISYNTSTVSGASAITGYYAISSPGNLVGYVSGTGGGNITVANLSLVTNYTFQVKAQNGYGNSLSSASSNSILGASVPSAPIIGTAYLLSNSSANVSYTASVNNGGYAITSYTAVSTPGNITATLSTSGSGNITVNGLSNSTTYSFVVYATSSYGNSNVSASSNSIATPGVPLAPSITRVTLANTSAVVISYNAASSGGNTITSFTAISTPGNIISTVNQSGSGTITMTGLSADSYTFKVYATNYYGNSSLSISSNTVPVGANVQYDQYYDNTALLITADTSSNAWVIDQSISPSSNVALTTGASLSTADSIFNGKSFYLDGQTYYSTAKISYASNSKFYIPGDFTLETYIKYTNTTSQGQFIFDILPVGYIYIHGPTGQIRLQLDKDGSGLPDIGGANYYVNMGTMSANAWHHIALCRSGTNVRVFVDGNQLGSTQTLSGNITAANGLTLGGNDFVGYIDQIRLTPGIARYIGTFTSPDALGKNTIYYT